MDELTKTLNHFFPNHTEVYQDATGAWHIDKDEVESRNLVVETYTKGEDGSWKKAKKK